MGRESLDSSYIVIETADAESIIDAQPCDDTQGAAPETPGEGGGRKRKIGETGGDSRLITILTPKKVNRQLLLTPVKRSKRLVINGLRSGSIKRVDVKQFGELEGRALVFGDAEPCADYLPLVECNECFAKLSRIESKKARRSVDSIVRKYMGR